LIKKLPKSAKIRHGPIVIKIIANLFLTKLKKNIFFLGLGEKNGCKK
jgi:hypothetical protein